MSKKHIGRLFRPFLKSSNGNAAIMVLSVILILTAFGFVSLLASGANIKMGSRYRNWSTEYYELDSQTEARLQLVDEQLRLADKYARLYMEKQYYKLSQSQFSTQATTLGGDDLALYTQIMKSTIRPHQLFHDNAWGMVANQTEDHYLSVVSDSAVAISNYKTDMLAYTNLFAKRVYFYFANTLLMSFDADDAIPGGYGADGIAYDNRLEFAYDNPAVLWDRTSTTDLDVWKTHPVKLVSFSGAVGDQKSVRAEIRVQEPTFEAVLQTITNPIQGNPLWGYAMASEGQIRFTSGATVYGDVLAASRLVTPPVGTDKGGVLVQTTGDVNLYGNVYAGGDVRVETGGGDLHVYKKGGTYPVAFTSEYGQRMKIYTDLVTSHPMEFLMDTTSANLYDAVNAPTYSESGSLAANAVPLLYRDGTTWGNVYCSDLEMSTVTNGSITVDGHVILGDDVEMNADNAKITIAGNCVGTKSDASVDGNPNGSSSILNNTALVNPNADVPVLNSSIVFGGGLVVPGVAFGEYATGPTAAQNGKYYYRTAESITGKTYDTFKWYLFPDDPTDAEALSNAGIIADAPLEYSLAGQDYELKQFIDYGGKLAMNQQEKYIYDKVNASGAVTYVYKSTAGGATAGYTLGAAMLHNGAGAAIAEVFMPNILGYAALNDGLDGQDVNGNLFSLAQTQLQHVLEKKTQSFGMDNTLTMSQYVDKPDLGVPSELNDFLGYNAKTYPLSGSVAAAGILSPDVARLYYAPANLQLNLNTDLKGILYCSGDLVITGTGSFTGVILCEGNITVNGNVTIYFNDTLIRDSLLPAVENKLIRDFFQPGAHYGAMYAFAKDYATTSGSKSMIKRYRIVKWVERQEN